MYKKSYRLTGKKRRATTVTIPGGEKLRSPQLQWLNARKKLMETKFQNSHNKNKSSPTTTNT